MTISHILLGLSALLSSTVAEDSAYVNIPVARQVGESTLTKRQTSNGTISLSQQQASYLANLTIGTPGQVVQLIVDTGSPLTWVNAGNVSTFTPGRSISSSGSTAGAAICQQNTCFTASSSSTLSVPSNTTVFDITYVDGTESVGTMVQDTITFQGLTDSSFQFGLVEYFYSPNGASGAIGGILGLSPDNQVASYRSISAATSATSSSGSSYFVPATILDQLLNAGRIKTLAFSLYLDEATEGQLTLGGVDSSRYSGPLTVIPIVNTDDGQGTSYYANLAGFGAGGKSANAISVGVPVVLDSGTTSMYIPYQAVEAVAQTIGGYFVPYDSSSGLLGIPCTLSTTIDFYFDNNGVIRIPTGLLQGGRISATQARRFGISTNADICLLNVFGTSDSSSYLLGDSFLRSAYVVYNLQQGQMAIAQAAYDGTSNIQTIGSGAFGIPNAVYNSSSPGAASSAVIPSITRSIPLPTATRVTRSGSIFTVTGTLTNTNTATSTARSVASTPEATNSMVLLCGATFIMVVAGVLSL